MPTPFETFCADCVRAEILACNPFDIDRPAGSSAPELILDPEDNWNRVFFKLLLVMANWFCATKEGMLFKILNDIRGLLSHWVSVLGRRTGGHIGVRWFFIPTDGTVSQSNDPYRHRVQKLKGRHSFFRLGNPNAARGKAGDRMQKAAR